MKAQAVFNLFENPESLAALAALADAGNYEAVAQRIAAWRKPQRVAPGEAFSVAEFAMLALFAECNTHLVAPNQCNQTGTNLREFWTREVDRYMRCAVQKYEEIVGINRPAYLGLAVVAPGPLRWKWAI